MVRVPGDRVLTWSSPFTRSGDTGDFRFSTDPEVIYFPAVDMALALTETQTERLHRVAEYEQSTTYEVVFLALEEYLSGKEDQHQRTHSRREAERRRELLRSFAGIDRG